MLSVPAGTSQVHSVPVLVSPVDVIAPLEERQQSNDDVDDEEDDTPLSFITKLAAIGDSYSAGIGAGDRLGDIGGIFDTQSGKFRSLCCETRKVMLIEPHRLGL